MASQDSTQRAAIVLPSNETQEETIRLPNNFLLSSVDIIKNVVDWQKTPLPEYEGRYAVILDNAFTATECKILIKLAELTANGKWEQAMVNVGLGEQELDTDVRDCGRILWDNTDIAERIWNRVRSSVPEIHRLQGVPYVTGKGPAKRNETWKVSKVNERMRFLKYGPGQYFRPHQDGCYEDTETGERSYFTLHLYLSEDADGGATSFHPWAATWDSDPERDFHVEPRIGRVLIFQQRDMLHSGADVTSGTKYTFRTDVMYKREDNDSEAAKDHL
ncbi:hypothetical protein ACLMJK_007542 [Lecanora helva]